MRQKIYFSVCMLFALLQLSFTSAYAQANHRPFRHAPSQVARIQQGDGSSVTIRVNKPQDWDEIYVEVIDANYTNWQDLACTKLAGDVYTCTIANPSSYAYIFFINVDYANYSGGEYISGGADFSPSNTCYRLGNDVITEEYEGETYYYVSCESIACDQLIPTCTCWEAITIGMSLAEGATSTESYRVVGYVTSIISAYDAASGTMSFYMADTQDGGNVLPVSLVSVSENIAVGTQVAVTAPIKFSKGGYYQTYGGTLENLSDEPSVPDDPTPFYGVYDLTAVGTLIDEWVPGDYATLNESSSSDDKFSYDVSANEGNDTYVYSNPNIVFRTKNTSGKTNAFAIYPGRRFVYGGKNGILLVKNTNAGDTIKIAVSSKGSTKAKFLDGSGEYPVNAVALSEDLTLPAYDTNNSSGDPFVWQELVYLSTGGDVMIKEFAGGFAINKIVVTAGGAAVPEEPVVDPITIRLTSLTSIPEPYIYAYDDNYNALIGAWPGVPMTPLENGMYSYTFAENISSVNIIFNNYNVNGAQTEDIVNVTSSTCYKLTGTYNNNGYDYLDFAQIDCSEEPEPIVMDTVTIRLNSYTVSWGNVYLYVWNGRTSYNNSGSVKIVAAKEMTLEDDGWWTYSFEVEQGTEFYVGFDYQADSSPYYSNTKTMFSTSTCFEYNGGLVATACKSLVPDETNTFAVHVATAGTFGPVMVQALGDLTWTDVLALTVTGSLNETDMTYFSRMTNLQQLDLSGTDIEHIEGCRDLARLNTVVLPASCVAVSENAFRNCSQLDSINLEHIQTVGNSAFYQCALREANMPEAQSIGTYAFYGNTALASAAMPQVSSIGQYAFYGNTALASIAIPQVSSIDQYAFYNCYALTQVDLSSVTSFGTYAFAMNTSSSSRLSQVTFSENLKEIPAYCFSGCAQLTAITLPAALKTIGNMALPYVTDVQLPGNVESVGNSNFNNASSINIPAKVTTWKSYSSSWQDVYCAIIVPPAFTVFGTDNVASATLHVPGISLAAYKLHDSWYKFGKIVSMDGELDDIAITGDFLLLTTDGISENANLSIESNGALTMSAADELAVANYVQQIGSMPKYVKEGYITGENYGLISTYTYSLQHTGILVANSPVSAANVTIRLVPKSGQWNFFSLPFDVNMSDIAVAALGTGTMGTSQWVIREYSGANRASGEGATWINVPADGMLHAHTGYILYWVVNGGTTYSNNSSSSSSAKLLYYFNMPAVNNENMPHIFATGDMNVPLTEYAAEFPQNGSWNLVGNPYPCAFDIQQMDFEAPITIWNGSGYAAYSLEDDYYTLRPAEAFFVQAPEGVNQITFHKEGRITSIVTETGVPQYYAPKRMRSANPARKVFNFTLSNGEYSDRARLVLNPQASADYEMTRDAAKMLSTDNTVPQLYLNDNGIRYAIDERPEQSTYTMGAYFGRTGEYTIRVNMPKNEDRQILLTDTETQTTTDLTEGDYTFTTTAGSYNARFIISFIARVPTDLEETQSLTKPVKTIENGNLIITSPQGKKFTVGGIEL